MYGYHGKILHVDLSKQLIEVETPSDDFYRTYMGGSAFGAYYLIKNTPKGADPLGPENPLCIMDSVLTGAPVPGLSRFTVTARSPITNLIGDSQAGGNWGAKLKHSGYDGIVIKGKAKAPQYLFIDNGEVELRPADHLWGKVTGDVERILRNEIGDQRIEVLQCGPAAENGVVYGALINGGNRSNGRTGMGTVLASKNIKAIVVRGNRIPKYANTEALRAIVRWGVQNYDASDVVGLGRWGTASVVLSQNRVGGLPTYNWDSGYFSSSDSISGQTMEREILKKRDTCFACIIRCKRVVEAKTDLCDIDPFYGGPEYETIAAFGSYCGISDLNAIAYANQLCNMYGMDTISCGATIAWAIDCFEHGILTSKDTGGLILKYGDPEILVKLVEMIGKAEGFGKILGKGSARAADSLGKGHSKLMVVKNNELPAHMPQIKRSLALIYLVNPFGPDHQSHEHDPAYMGYPDRMAELGLLSPQKANGLNREKVEFALVTQHFYSMLDSLNVCQFAIGPAWQLYGPSQLVDIVNAITGWEITLEDLMKVGERRLNLLQSFNIRERGNEKDSLPQKLFIPLKGGPSDGVAITKEEVWDAVSIYYEMAGWDEFGRPQKDKLESLNLGWLVNTL